MYLKIIELAESFGVEESVVEGWVRHEGLPCISDRGRLLFDRAQVVAWAAERGYAGKAGFLAPERSTVRPGRPLELLLRTGGIWRDVAATEVIPLLEKIISGLPGATPPVLQILRQRLRSPRGINWAPVGQGLALPHLRVPVALGRDAGTLALLMLRDPLILDESPPDAIPVTRLLFFIAPSPRVHLELLAQLSSALTKGDLRPRVLAGAPDEDIFSVLATAEWKRHGPVPLPEEGTS